MSMTKLENGKRVNLTPEEIAEHNQKNADFESQKVKDMALRLLSALDMQADLTRKDENIMDLVKKIDPTVKFHGSASEVVEEKEFYRDFLRGTRTSFDELMQGHEEFVAEKQAGTRAVKARIL